MTLLPGAQAAAKLGLPWHRHKPGDRKTADKSSRAHAHVLHATEVLEWPVVTSNTAWADRMSPTVPRFVSDFSWVVIERIRGTEASRGMLRFVLSWACHSSAPLRKLSLYPANSSLLIGACVFICILMSVFFSSLKQTNGYDGDFYGSQSLNRRSGRVSIVNLHDTKCQQVAAKLKQKIAKFSLFFFVIVGHYPLPSPTP